jgi:prophage DNA circulation protein
VDVKAESDAQVSNNASSDASLIPTKPLETTSKLTDAGAVLSDDLVKMPLLLPKKSLVSTAKDEVNNTKTEGASAVKDIPTPEHFAKIMQESYANIFKWAKLQQADKAAKAESKVKSADTSSLASKISQQVDSKLASVNPAGLLDAQEKISSMFKKKFNPSNSF